MPVGAELAIGVVSALFGAGVAWGVMRSKISDLEEDIKAMRANCVAQCAQFVRKDTFDAVIGPLHSMLEELQRDVKKLLTLVTRQVD